MPTDEARLAGGAARGDSGGELEPRRRGSSSNKICGQGRGEVQARLPPWAVLASTSAYLAQPRGCGMSGRRPQRHIEHDDAIRNNERGNHHDENKIPEIPKRHDVTASIETRGRWLPSTSQTPLHRRWGDSPCYPSIAPVLSPPPLHLPSAADMKGTPSNLDTLLWVYHFHSSTEVRVGEWPTQRRHLERAPAPAAVTLSL